MIQLALWEDILPQELTRLQLDWVRAVNNRISKEKTNNYEIIDGQCLPVFLSPEYNEAREKEMDLFDDLIDYAPYYKVFTGIYEYLDK